MICWQLIQWRSLHTKLFIDQQQRNSTFLYSLESKIGSLFKLHYSWFQDLVEKRGWIECEASNLNFHNQLVKGAFIIVEHI